MQTEFQVLASRGQPPRKPGQRGRRIGERGKGQARQNNATRRKRGQKGAVFCAKPPQGKFVEKMGKSDGTIPSTGATETDGYLSKVLVFQGFLGLQTLGFLIRKNRGHGNRCSGSTEAENQGQNGKTGWRSDGTPPSSPKQKMGRNLT